MIVTKIIGGLGNQLFQYAIARHLSIKNNSPLYLDVRAYKEYYNLHQYGLSHFNIKGEEADQSILDNFIYTSNIFKRVKRKIKSLFQAKQNIKEESLAFNPEALKLSGNFYLEGYWQCEKYFSEIRNVLLKDFEIITPASNENQVLLTTLKKSNNNVSIHIRRGDYANDEKTRATHGLCSLDYYYKAIDYIKEKLTDCHFYIFSDDPQWASDHLKIGENSTLVDFNNATTNYEDLRLMSHCNHHIIANSTFSWWGAWLNTSEQKLVIAPKKWFADATISSSDLIPSSWTRL